MGIKLDHGKQTELANAVGIPVQMLNDIIHGRKKCPGTRAIALAAVSKGIIGETIHTDEWILMGMGLRKGDKCYDDAGTDGAEEAGRV